MDMHDRESTVLEEEDCLVGGNGSEVGGELAADGLNPPAAELAECTLILWAVARGLRPAEGWFKAVGLSERQVATLARQHGGQVARLRQLHTAGELLDDGELLVLLRARLAEGLIEVFLDAEAAVSTPTCGPCLGGHMGVLAEGERCISTTNRNFRTRMGHEDSEVYLSGPAVAAASAILGRIGSPEEV